MFLHNIQGMIRKFWEWKKWNKTQPFDTFILFNIFDRKNKISKLSISVGIHCKQGKGVLNWENGHSWS